MLLHPLRPFLLVGQMPSAFETATRAFDNSQGHLIAERLGWPHARLLHYFDTVYLNEARGNEFDEEEGAMRASLLLEQINTDDPWEFVLVIGHQGARILSAPMLKFSGIGTPDGSSLLGAAPIPRAGGGHEITVREFWKYVAEMVNGHLEYLTWMEIETVQAAEDGTA